MAGTFDQHTLIALQSGWKTLAQNQQTFQDLFDGLPSGYTADIHGQLAPGGEANHVYFRSRFAPDQDVLPIVAVQSSEEPVEEVPLGFFSGFTSNNEERLAMYTRETAHIQIFAPNPEMLRGLHVAIRAIMIGHNQWFIDSAGYEGIQYEGAGDLEAEAGLLAEQGLGAHVRSQRWSAFGRAHWVGAAVTQKNPFVHAVDITVGGTDGGVTPTE